MSKATVTEYIPYGKPQELTNIITHATITAALGFVGQVLSFNKKLCCRDSYLHAVRNYV